MCMRKLRLHSLDVAQHTGIDWIFVTQIEINKRLNATRDIIIRVSSRVRMISPKVLWQRMNLKLFAANPLLIVYILALTQETASNERVLYDSCNRTGLTRLTGIALLIMSCRFRALKLFKGHALIFQSATRS